MHAVNPGGMCRFMWGAWSKRGKRGRTFAARHMPPAACTDNFYIIYERAS